MKQKLRHTICGEETNLLVPCVKTTTHGLHSFRYVSTTLCTRLPEDLRFTTLLREFKFKVRQISIQQIWNLQRLSGYELAGNEIFLRHGSSGDWGS